MITMAKHCAVETYFHDTSGRDLPIVIFQMQLCIPFERKLLYSMIYMKWLLWWFVFQIAREVAEQGATFGKVAGAIGLVFSVAGIIADITTMIQKSYDIHKGSQSDLAKKMRALASQIKCQTRTQTLSVTYNSQHDRISFN